MNQDDVRHLADSLRTVFQSPNEQDSNGEIANVVDGLYAIARAIHELAHAVRQLGVAQEDREP